MKLLNAIHKAIRELEKSGRTDVAAELYQFATDAALLEEHKYFLARLNSVKASLVDLQDNLDIYGFVEASSQIDAIQRDLDARLISFSEANPIDSVLHSYRLLHRIASRNVIATNEDLLIRLEKIVEDETLSEREILQAVHKQLLGLPEHEKKNILYVLAKEHNLSLPVEKLAHVIDVEEDEDEDECLTNAKTLKERENCLAPDPKTDLKMFHSFPQAPNMWSGFTYEAPVPYQQSNQLNFWSIASHSPFTRIAQAENSLADIDAAFASFDKELEQVIQQDASSPEIDSSFANFDGEVAKLMEEPDSQPTIEQSSNETGQESTTAQVIAAITDLDLGVWATQLLTRLVGKVGSSIAPELMLRCIPYLARLTSIPVIGRVFAVFVGAVGGAAIAAFISQLAMVILSGQLGYEYIGPWFREYLQKKHPDIAKQIDNVADSTYEGASEMLQNTMGTPLGGSETETQQQQAQQTLSTSALGIQIATVLRSITSDVDLADHTKYVNEYKVLIDQKMKPAQALKQIVQKISKEKNKPITNIDALVQKALQGSRKVRQQRSK